MEMDYFAIYMWNVRFKTERICATNQNNDDKDNAMFFLMTSNYQFTGFSHFVFNLLSVWKGYKKLLLWYVLDRQILCPRYPSRFRPH